MEPGPNVQATEQVATVLATIACYLAVVVEDQGGVYADEDEDFAADWDEDLVSVADPRHGTTHAGVPLHDALVDLEEVQPLSLGNQLCLLLAAERWQEGNKFLALEALRGIVPEWRM